MDNIQEPRRYTRYYFGSGGVDHAVDTDTNKTFCGRDVPAGAKLDSSWVTGISCIRCASKIPALGAQAAYVREYNQYHRLVRAVEDIEEHLALIEKNKEEAKAKRAIARYRKGLLVGLRDHIRLSNRPTRLEETQLMDELLDGTRS
jgi:tRNA-dihydrouridine synthase